MSHSRLRLAALFVGIGALVCSQSIVATLRAAEEKPPTGRVSVSANSENEKLRHRPVMVSVIQDGKILQQEEIRIGSSTSFSNLIVGTYEIRIEGEGCKTLVKRGIQVRDDFTTNILGGPLEQGQGVHVVEYATGGLTREELADRLAKIEAMLAKLDARLTADAKSAK